MDTRKQGLLGAMFGDMEYMVENRDQMQRMADQYGALRNAMGRAPTEQELGFFLRNRIIRVDPSSVVRPNEDAGFYGRSNNFERMMYSDANEQALDLRDQMRILEGRAANPDRYTDPQSYETMSRSAGGPEGLRRYYEMMRQLMPERGVR